MEQSLFWIIYGFSWAIQIHCWKMYFDKFRFLYDFEICPNCSRNSLFCYFVRLLAPPIFKYFLKQGSCMKLCMPLPNDIPQDSFSSYVPCINDLQDMFFLFFSMVALVVCPSKTNVDIYSGWLRSWKILEMFLEKKICSWFFSIVRCSWNVLEKNNSWSFLLKMFQNKYEYWIMYLA